MEMNRSRLEGNSGQDDSKEDEDGSKETDPDFRQSNDWKESEEDLQEDQFMSGFYHFLTRGAKIVKGGSLDLPNFLSSFNGTYYPHQPPPFKRAVQQDQGPDGIRRKRNLLYFMHQHEENFCRTEQGFLGAHRAMFQHSQGSNTSLEESLEEKMKKLIAFRAENKLLEVLSEIIKQVCAQDFEGNLTILMDEARWRVLQKSCWMSVMHLDGFKDTSDVKQFKDNIWQNMSNATKNKSEAELSNNWDFQNDLTLYNLAYTSRLKLEEFLAQNKDRIRINIQYYTADADQTERIERTELPEDREADEEDDEKQNDSTGNTPSVGDEKETM